MTNFALKPKLTGLAAKKAAAQAEGLMKAEPQFKLMPIEECTDRIGIVFDDSGSMASQMENAHKGVEEFLRSCKAGATAVALYPLCEKPRSLTNDLPALAADVKTISASGGTPLYKVITKMLKAENLTRGITFSDGCPDWSSEYTMDSACALATEKKIPIDTVFLGYAGSTGAAIMREIAERTGGVYLCFDPAKTNFRESFKYLAPGYRALLADKSFVDKIQGR